MPYLHKRAAIVYFTFLLLATVLSIALLSIDYRFIISNEIIWFVNNIAAEGIFTVLCLLKKEESIESAYIYAQLLPILAFVYICVIGYLIDGVQDILRSLHGLLCFLSCYIISLSYISKRFFGIVRAVLGSLLLFFILVGIYFTMIFGQFGQTTIVRQVISPDKSYTAILIDSDQGALGGDTIVNIQYHTCVMNVGFGEFVKTTTIYFGNWGEFETMSLEWEDDRTLLISGRPYTID